MTDTEQHEVEQAAEAGTPDQYASVEKVIPAIMRHEDYPPAHVERVEVNLLSTGEATWRVFVRGEREPRGGFLSREELA